MDLYSYCNGDPVNRYDPDGRVATGVLTGQSYNAASSVGSALGSSGLFGEARTLYQLSIGVNQATSLIENKAGFPSGSLNALPFALGPEAAPLSAAFAGIRYLGAAAEGLADFRALSTDAGLVIPAARGPVRAFEVGTADDLLVRSVRGDGLDVHHVAQAHPLEQIIPGYNRATAPAITVPRAQHSTIPTVRGPYTGTARDQLAKDIWDLRNYTDAPNPSLQELINMNKQMYPGAYTK
jgi:hypothetical protein